MQNCACTTFRNPITVSDVYRVRDFVVGSGGKCLIWFNLNISVYNIFLSVLHLYNVIINLPNHSYIISLKISDNTTYPNLDTNQKYFHCGIGSGDVLLDTKEAYACNNPNWGDQVYKINKGEFHTIPINPLVI